MRSLLAPGLLLLACAHAPPVRASLGVQRSDPVELCFPIGEDVYLRALRCADGEPARWRRLGSVGTRTPLAKADDPRLLEQMDAGHPLAPGEPDLHILDAVELSCVQAGPQHEPVTIYLDIYHCPPREPPAPRGFTLAQ